MVETQNRSNKDLEVRRNESASQWELVLEGDVIGTTEYRYEGGTYVLPSVQVDPEHRGGGMAGTMVKAALDEVRSEGASIVPVCPYVVTFLKRHPEYRDLQKDS